MRLNRLIIFISFLLTSCSQTKSRKIILDDVIAEGEISPDTIFNGRIKFYDTATNNLVTDANFKAGKLDGKRTDYYLNGKIKDLVYYNNDMEVGAVSNFDSGGQIAVKQDYYFGLKVGSNIQYKKGKISKYYFSSFDNEDLFFIDYDSLYQKEVKRINGNRFFFFFSNNITTITSTDKTLEGEQYLLYLVNPPNFNFQYSLCVVNIKDSIIRVEKEFNMTKTWDTFTVKTAILKAGERFALKLSFEHNLSEKDREKIDMFKHL